MTKKTLLILFCSILIFGCTTTDQSSEDVDQKNTINVNIGNEPPTLDWSLAMDGTSYNILNNLMEGLTKFDDSLVPQPALAESWEISEDGTTYTFKIRGNVNWSDGEPLKAQDFEYSWKRILNPDTGGHYAYFLYDVENAEEYNTGKIDDPDKVGVKALD